MIRISAHVDDKSTDRQPATPDPPATGYSYLCRVWEYSQHVQLTMCMCAAWTLIHIASGMVHVGSYCKTSTSTVRYRIEKFG
jgi:hypothetical protein